MRRMIGASAVAMAFIACAKQPAEPPKTAARAALATAATDPCVTSTAPAASRLLYSGATAVQYGDSALVAALLSDAAGNPLASRTVVFSLAGQALAATTDANGSAQLLWPANADPQALAVGLSFAGDAAVAPAQASATLQISPRPTVLRILSPAALAQGDGQAVTAQLTGRDGSAIAGKSISFSLSGASSSAVTDANGVAQATLAVPSGGQEILTAAFPGDPADLASSAQAALPVYAPSQFVIWGGNAAGLSLGAHVQFWGAQWASQVEGGGISSFKGYADSVPAFALCGQGCWTAKPGNSFPPSTVAPYIGVMVATSMTKPGRTISGNSAALAILKVDQPSSYGPNPGHPGFGTIVAVLEPGTVFAAEPALQATLASPAVALPGQRFDAVLSIANGGGQAATSVAVAETLSAGTPATASASLGAIAAGARASQTFTQTAPAVPARQPAETAAAYAQRLGALDGLAMVSSVRVSYADVAGAQDPDALGSARTALSVPRLTVGILAPASALPGTAVNAPITIANVGSAAAAGASLAVTLPDGSGQTFALGPIAAGASVQQTASWTVPVLAPQGSGEDNGAYLARLHLADGQPLPWSASATWTDAAGNSYGAVDQQAQSIERLPILTLAAPALQAMLPSQSTAAAFVLANAGSCAAASASLQITNPDGSRASAQVSLAAAQSVSLPLALAAPALAAKGAAQTDAAYLAQLASLDGSALSFAFSLGWTDAAGAQYGLEKGAVPSTLVVPRLQLSIAAADGGRFTITVRNAGLAQATNVALALVRADGSTLAVPLGASSVAPSASLTATATDANATAGQVETAQLTWTDANGGTYGPITAGAAAQGGIASLALTPRLAGPIVVGTTQPFSAVLQGRGGAPIAAATVQFTVTGANPGTASAVTDATGTARFSYVGAKSGVDSVVATAQGATSNAAQVTWLVPSQPVSTSTVLGRFFVSDGATWHIAPTATPAFSQFFPTINFNPPGGTVPGNTSGVYEMTRPLTDVVTDVNGNFTGTIVAQGNGKQAGVGDLFSFSAAFTGSLTVAAAGNVVFNFYSDDGFFFGVGGGATRVSGPMVNVPPGGRTTFSDLPIMGSYNQPTGPVANTIVVSFPAAGTYSYELDYSECCGGQIALTMTSGTSNHGVPPTGAVTLSPASPPSLPAGQIQLVKALTTDAAGLPVANAPVALIVTGANPQHQSAITDASGHATFQVGGANAGADTLQAGAPLSGMTAYSNVVQLNRTQPQGAVVTTLVPQGWIGAPAMSAVVLQPTAITVAAGVSLTSGTLTYWPTSNPSAVTTINANTTGGGTLGVFDPTLLPNGGYTLQLDAFSGGAEQLSQILLTVAGNHKPGRIVSTVTEFHVPLAGVPIAVSRTYDSLLRGQSGDFGYGWKLGTSTGLAVDGSGNVSFDVNGDRQTFLLQPQPTSWIFPWVQQVQYVPQAGARGTLTSDGCLQVTALQNQWDCLLSADAYRPTVFTYTDPRGRVFTMGAGGELRSIRDPSGTTLTVTAAGITSSAGGVVVPFARDGQGRISSITDPAGNVYRYAYDGNGNLASVAYPGVAAPETYVWSADHLLLSEVDPRGASSSTTYDAQGRLQSVTTPAVPAPGGRLVSFTTQFAYDVANRTVRTTYPDGSVTTRRDDSAGSPVSFTDGLGRTTSYRYDANENLVQVTDPLGNATNYTRDALGNPTSTQLPGLPADAKTYTPFGAVASQTDPAGLNTVVTSYDAFGNPVQITDGLAGADHPLAKRSFDGAGNLLSWTDAAGNARTYQYSTEGYLLASVDPLQGKVAYARDALGHATAITDARGATTQLRYDAMGRRSAKVDPAGVVTNFTYDGNGNLTDTVEAAGTALQRVTHVDYDNLNRVSKITYPDQTTLQLFHDFRGNRIAEIDELGRTVNYSYDLAGQLVSMTRAAGTPDAATVSLAYDGAGRKISSTDELGHTTIWAYDAAGRQISMQDPLGHKTTYAYDADGRRSSSTDAAGQVTSYQRDARGRLIAQTDPTVPPSTTQFTYDGLGHTLSRQDQSGHATVWSYDAAGRLASSKDALGNTTGFAYDANGNLTAQTDANRHTTAFQYDALNRQISRTLPLGQSEASAYDGLGRIASRTDFNGHTTTYSYDSRNRLVRRSPDLAFHEQAVAYAYTATGQRASMTDSTGVTSYSYDNLDRLIAKATPEGTLSYSYDAHGNLRSLASSNANGGSATYSYDAANRLAAVGDQRLSGATTSYVWDAVGNLIQVAYPNAVQSANVFDPAHRLTKTCVAAGPQACSSTSGLASYAYTLAPTGLRTGAIELSGRNAAYSYDADNRLVSEAVTGDPGAINGTAGYSYDGVGNRTQLTSTLAPVPPALSSYDANDRLSSQATDGNGNALTSGGIANTFDSEDRLVSRGGVSLAYDGDGQLVSETAGGVTTSYLVDDRNPTGVAQVIDELVGGAVQRTYAYGARRISQNRRTGSGWTAHYYQYDGHGSVRALTDSAGSVSDSYQFDAFGRPLSSAGSTPNRFLYSGEQYDDATGLYYLRARHYDPATGRFLTMDSLPGRAAAPASLNRYSYAENDPVNGLDPSGHEVVVEYVLTLNVHLRGVKIKAKGSCSIDVLTGAPSCKISPDNLSDAAFGLALDNGGFDDNAKLALNLSYCEGKFFAGLDELLGKALDGKPVDPNAGPKISNEYVKCLKDALHEYFTAGVK